MNEFQVKKFILSWNDETSISIYNLYFFRLNYLNFIKIMNILKKLRAREEAAETTVKKEINVLSKKVSNIGS